METRKLLLDAGFGARMTCPEWEQLLELAEAIEATIQLPIPRAAFVATAAADLAVTAPSLLACWDFSTELETVRATKPTPHGCTEVWSDFFNKFPE